MKSRKIVTPNNNTKIREKNIDNISTQPDIQLSPTVKDLNSEDNELMKKLIIQKINSKTLSFSLKKEKHFNNSDITNKQKELAIMSENNIQDDKISNILFKLHCNSNNLNNIALTSNNLNAELLKIDTNDALSDLNLLNIDTKTLQTPKELIEDNIMKYENTNMEIIEKPKNGIYRKVNLKKKNSLIDTSLLNKTKNQIASFNLTNLDMKKNSASLNNSNASIKSSNPKVTKNKLDRSNVYRNSISIDTKKEKLNEIKENKELKTNDITKEYLDLIPFFENMIGNNFNSFNENGLLNCLNSQDKNTLIKDLNKKVKSVSCLENNYSALKINDEKNKNNEKLNNKLENFKSRNEVKRSCQTISYDNYNHISSLPKSSSKNIAYVTKRTEVKSNIKQKNS